VRLTRQILTSTTSYTFTYTQPYLGHNLKMATETDTLSFSLPTSTAPTDVSESTCMPHSMPFLQQPSAYPPQNIPAEWDTRIPPMQTPATHAQQFCNEGSSTGSGSGCFNDGGLLYRVQAERECREGPGKTVEEACQRSLNCFNVPYRSCFDYWQGSHCCPCYFLGSLAGASMPSFIGCCSEMATKP
jgi:hypothetical protein